MIAAIVLGLTPPQACPDGPAGGAVRALASNQLSHFGIVSVSEDWAAASGWDVEVPSACDGPIALPFETGLIYTDDHTLEIDPTRAPARLVAGRLSGPKGFRLHETASLDGYRFVTGAVAGGVRAWEVGVWVAKDGSDTLVAAYRQRHWGTGLEVVKLLRSRLPIVAITCNLKAPPDGATVTLVQRVGPHHYRLLTTDWRQAGLSWTR